MEKRRRGRPSITEKLAGSSADAYEKVLKQGKKFRSRRSISDLAYVIVAGQILFSEAASDIDGIELICSDEYQCRSILNQLGRMYRQDGYSEHDVLEIAKEAIQEKKMGEALKKSNSISSIDEKQASGNAASMQKKQDTIGILLIL